MPMNRVVVTGLGPMSSIGNGCDETWQSIMNNRLNLVKEKYLIDDKEWGEFYLHKMRHFNIENFKLPRENFEFVKNMRTVKREDIDLYYFLAVIKLALDDSGLKYNVSDNDIGLMLTHENPGIETFFEELIDSIHEVFEDAGKAPSKLDLAKAIYDKGCKERGYNLQTFSYLFSAAKVFGLHGYSLFINNACASGLFAIESAARQIRLGISPAVIVAAVDNPTKIYKYLWFKERGLYADDGICRPFSKDSNGIVFGDGGAALVLEDYKHAKKRKADIYAEYLGGGFSLEGWKITVPNIADDSYLRSFSKALKSADIKPDDIDFVNPHGVGMKVTDTYEAGTINRIFKKKRPLISAFKSRVGHNLGGSSLIETAISLLALKNNVIPATLNIDSQETRYKLNIVKENTKSSITKIAKMACGFAGFNGICIFGRTKKGL